ncbi:DUF3769 domain-containing protein [Moorena sp. SIO3I8]|uniref:DUF3769 domain-containing protein n=1 Tax=Moorena sp. SIO3I8 TaxID=2607833 RepID=UPI0013BF0088|nr:DUF3769 domain-containing protein [Moorena sp. SIO3I8]NEO06675.1 DUF3769 domain-containing protein [Moorena sp. SIO3I8]
MPQPVQPPVVPAIIQTVKPSQTTSHLDELSQTITVSAQYQKQQNQVLLKPYPTGELKIEAFPILATDKSAASLGPPISPAVGQTLPRITNSQDNWQLGQGQQWQQALLKLGIKQPLNPDLTSLLKSPTPEAPSTLEPEFSTRVSPRFSSSVTSETPVADSGYDSAPLAPQRAIPRWGEQNLQSPLPPSPPNFGGNYRTSIEQRQPDRQADSQPEIKPEPGNQEIFFAVKSYPKPCSTLETLPNPDESLSINSNCPLPIARSKRIIAQERGGETREFELIIPEQSNPASLDETAPPSDQDLSQPQSGSELDSEVTAPTITFDTNEQLDILELTSDRQEYDQTRQVITAVGNVTLRFQDALLEADRLQVNLPTRIVVADGNVALTRGNQVLEGERFEYYFVQDTGVVFKARGEFVRASSDSGPPPPTQPVSRRIINSQPLTGISNPGAFAIEFGARVIPNAETGTSTTTIESPEIEGTINRFRYEADRVEFDGLEGVATNVRITNDPFSPPELEWRTRNARFRRISPEVDEVVAKNPRLVFDQGFSLPTFRERFVIDRRERQPSLLDFGYDDDDRGGVFIQRGFKIVETPSVRFSLTPQFFLQKAILGDNDEDENNDAEGGGVIDPANFGLLVDLDATLGPRTTLVGSAALTSLDPEDLENETRGSLRLRQTIGNTYPHRLTLEASYRDRLFNGSLGFQTVQSSIGGIFESPTIPLGKTGLTIRYQAGVQRINANTDRVDLLPLPPRDNNRINLTRYQGSATLTWTQPLWQGKILPATAEEGMRYTPAPLLPNIQLNSSITGVASAYSNGDSQEFLRGNIGLTGQFGHFSKPFLDYTGFNISYSQVALGNTSPFLFDRVADTRILNAGITQQLYGPFRVGFQTSLNLDTNQEISTDFFLEYSRRSYNILLRYNPVQQRGLVGLRINDFNWTGATEPFDTFSNSWEDD